MLLAVMCWAIYLFIVSTAWELLRRFTCHAVLVVFAITIKTERGKKMCSITYVDVLLFFSSLPFYFIPSSYLLCVPPTQPPPSCTAHNTHVDLKSTWIVVARCFLSHCAHLFFLFAIQLVVSATICQKMDFIRFSGSMRMRVCHQAGHKLPKQMGILFVEKYTMPCLFIWWVGRF